MRKCGDCQLCCRVLPIAEIGKAAGVKCSNQKFGVGCKVHGTTAQPASCRMWNCWWLMNPGLNLPRPDRAGYVIDMAADFIVFGEDVHNGKRVPALQVWADPARPDAWRGALNWIKNAILPKDACAVIRFGSQKAIVIVPPKLSGTGEWAEVDTSRMMNPIAAANVRQKMLQDAMEEAASQNQQEGK